MRLHRPLLAVAVLTAGCAARAPRSNDARPPSPPSLRLRDGIRPTGYALRLEIDPRRPRFAGEVTIDLALDRRQESVWIHARGLVAHEISLSAPGAAPQHPRWRQAGPELVELQLERPLAAGSARLEVRYDAPFDPGLEGAFRVESGPPGGKEWYAFTQFEATYARRALPCFDEPQWKTPFDLTLIVSGADRAVANTPLRDEARLPDGRRRLRYATTAALPTYLLAFAVGPLDIVAAPPIPPSRVRAQPLPLSAVTTRGRGDRVAFALRLAAEVVPRLEDYFDVAYPWPKLDLIAVPDFAPGAMENAGAITFRDRLLLVDEATAPVSQQRLVAEVLAHEIGHQWFGDLVTMAWWDDVWLNESFATWIAARVGEEWRPDDETRLDLVQRIGGALAADSLAATRRIREPITSDDDILNAFDSITYEKGAGVLAMFERFLGAATFRDGVRAYLKRHQGGSATTADFVAALSATAGRDLAAPLSGFLDQPGVPLVDVKVVCDGAPRLLLHQSRFLPVGSRAAREQVWQIPFCARAEIAGRVEERCTLLSARDGVLPLAGCPAWVLPNPDSAGYYRWSLDATAWTALRERGLPHLRLLDHVALDDGLAAGFASASRSASEVLAFAPRLAAHEHSAIATAPMELIAFAREQLVEAALRPAVEAYARGLYRARFEALGWTAAATESADRRLLRARLVSFLAATGRDPEVRRELAQRGRAFLGVGSDGALHPDQVDTNLLGAALRIAASEDDGPLFTAASRRLLETEDPLLRQQLAAAIGMVTAPGLAARVDALALDPRLRANDRMQLVEQRLAFVETRDRGWDFVRAHFDELSARLPSEQAIGLVDLAGELCEAARIVEAASFFAPRIARMPGGPARLRRAVEAAELCAASAAAQAASARAFFRAHAAAAARPR